MGVNGGPWGLCGRVFGALGGGLASLLAGSLGALRWGFWGPFWGLRWCFWTKKKNGVQGTRGSGHMFQKLKMIIISSKFHILVCLRGVAWGGPSGVLRGSPRLPPVAFGPSELRLASCTYICTLAQKISPDSKLTWPGSNNHRARRDHSMGHGARLYISLGVCLGAQPNQC